MDRNIVQDIVGISREEFATWVELGGKLLLGIGAICYAVGLVVVNAYLLRYGVYSASLFRTEICVGSASIRPANKRLHRTAARQEQGAAAGEPRSLGSLTTRWGREQRST